MIVQVCGWQVPLTETFNNFEVSEEPFKPKPIPGLAGGYQVIT